ncbi:hypothetical protein [Moorena sp. SIO2C4]|uniref:hypothetical protein n=1 Tax=Moorena sp. SIO2C4 TaxID=2607824 RepID=UPI0013CDB83B|nr:hypothetical protein [Moorena sp. SIO2C4]NES40223.1 hypothetical protein [Moorena sp. SIO2C4]
MTIVLKYYSQAPHCASCVSPEEAQGEEPDKDFAAKNLQKACTALKGLKEAGETVFRD